MNNVLPPRYQRGEREVFVSQAKMEDLVSLCKRRGFIYQGSDVYGGLSGTWDYGPLGVALKRNIMNLWWQHFVDSRDDMYGVDAAILMNQKVWQASGHIDTFVDPLIECNECRKRYRTDKLIGNTNNYRWLLGYFAKRAKQESDENFEDMETLCEYYLDNKNSEPINKGAIDKIAKAIDTVKTDNEKLKDLILGGKYLGIFPSFYLESIQNQSCQNCGKIDWSTSRTFNMMFKTHVGATESEDSVSYLRPETAQGIFTNFKNVVDTFYPNLPFGLAQMGKAFRNEIAPRDFIFRSREFEQMEIEYFVHPDEWQAAFDELLASTHEFLGKLGLKPEHIHELDVPEEDRAHYSKKTIDIEYEYPIGKEELMGIAYRTDFDLSNIQRVSKKSMEYQVKGTNEKFVPHVIEPSFGVERAVMAVLSAAYTEDEVNGEKRVYLRLPEHLAPVKFAISPLLKNKPELVEKAREVYRALKKKHGAVMWDDNGNIGKRYRRQDEIGTPYCVVIDFQTLEDGTVTVRERDTTEQRRVDTQEIM